MAISDHIRKVFGSWNIQLASPEKVIQATGNKISSIPLFSWQPNGFRSFLDPELLYHPTLAVVAGIWGNELLLSPHELVKTNQAIVVNLIYREKLIFSP